MWLVVYKMNYYPSVYECETLEEAEKVYDNLLKENFVDEEDEEWINKDDKIYIAKVEKECGVAAGDVEWYVYGRE